MTYDLKNKGTLFSSTLNVAEINLHLFSWSKVILVSYDYFVFLKTLDIQLHSTKLQNANISDIYPKNKDTLYSTISKGALVFMIRGYPGELWSFARFPFISKNSNLELPVEG